MTATEMILINTPQGPTYVTPNDYVRTFATNDNLGAIDAGQAAVAAAGAASASIAAGGATASALIAAGVGAQAIPVIGQILGGLALIGGYLLQARAKAKSIKAQGAQVDTATVELQIQNAELDGMINNSNASLNNIKSEIGRLGLSGAALDGFSDFLKKTFTPARYQQSILDDKIQNYDALLKQMEAKISILQDLQNELNALYEKLTRGKNLQKALLIGGGIAIGLTALYFLNQKFKWFKL